MRSSRAAALMLVTLATFTDILAYSIAVPVLPDLTRRFGASPTVVGLLFASFGVSVVATAVPMGAASDRMGRRLPLVFGCVALAASTAIFAVADRLSLLFAARLAQGAADAVTWVVGFALIADVYGPGERGRAMGTVMSATTVGFMIGPTLGGWLYERGGPTVPYFPVAALSLVAAAGFVWWRPPAPDHATEPHVPLSRLLRLPAVALCTAVVVAGGGTLAMLEPVLSLHLSQQLGLGPSRVGMVFGSAAIMSAVLHPVAGRIADRIGGRQLMVSGLVAMALLLPLLAAIRSFESAVLMNALFSIAVAMVVTPSLAYMAAATWSGGIRSFGVAYGVYNVAWALGLLVGPSVGAAIYERAGFARLVIGWAAVLLATALALARTAAASRSRQAV